MIEIRSATKNDISTLALLGRITFTESHGHFIENKEDLLTYNDKAFSLETLETCLQTPNNLFYIMYRKGFPIGYAKIVLNATSKHVTSEKSCRLERIYILQEFIPLKLGQHLFDFTLKKIVALRHNYIWLTVNIHNARAINFYKKNDFIEIGTLDFVVADKGYEN